MDFQMSDESDLSKFVELDQYLGYSFCKSEAPLLMDTTCFSYQHLLPHLMEQCNNCQQQQQNSRIRQLDQQASSCGTPINQYMISNNDSKNNINLSHRQLSNSSAVSLSSNAMNSLAHANLSSHASLTSPLLFSQSKDPLFQPLPTSYTFNYTLAASTSSATKLSEEPLTCLNQGQSYELKLKKQFSSNDGDAGQDGPKDQTAYLSEIKIMFHQRRLQHTEKEQFAVWLKSRTGLRLIELDVPLTYNIIDIQEPKPRPNEVAVIWSASVEASVSIKINCISTEFTAKKHGGEKGVPFRLQIDTYSIYWNEEKTNKREKDSYKIKELVNKCYCLVKVFKPNGADRKNKNDFMKISKLPLMEKDLYHPSYEVTTFAELPLAKVSNDNVDKDVESTNLIMNQPSQYIKASETDPTKNLDCDNRETDSVRKAKLIDKLNIKQKFFDQRSSPSTDKTFNFINYTNIKDGLNSNQNYIDIEKSFEKDDNKNFNSAASTPSSSQLSPSSSRSSPLAIKKIIRKNGEKANLSSSNLSVGATSEEVTDWLKSQNCGDDLINQFKFYNGEDMYRLSRDDLKIICGVAEGIRIFNALVKGMKTTKLLLFVSPKNYSDHESEVLLRKWMSSDIVAPDSPNNVTSSTVSNGSFSNLAHNIDNMYLSKHFQNNQTHKKRYSKNQPQNQHIEANQSNEPEKETLKKVKNSTNYDENENNVKTYATKAFLPVLRCGDKRPSQWQLLIVAPKKSKQLEELMVDGWEVTSVYQPINLQECSVEELIEKLISVCQIPTKTSKFKIHLLKDGTRINVTDDYLQRFENESSYNVEVESSTDDLDLTIFVMKP